MLFYWNHIARRQTAPMMLHGLAVTDPIRQFNDYGYTMCSTISGINCSIWDALGLKSRYWDISNHTVPEVEYGGRWHMYDNSMTAIYTLCDGKTIAGVAEIGAPGACAASGGRTEPGHVARYHCLTATSPRGFLTGADTIRSLDEEYRCFNPNGLKLRTYFFDWDRGHRYILNLRDHEAYTRHYHSLGASPEFYVPNEDGRDPEAANERYRLRGNGVWLFNPLADPAAPETESMENIVPWPDGGLAPARAAQPGEAVFKIDAANVITALRIRARFLRRTESDLAAVAVSTVNGLSWLEIWRSDATGDPWLDRRLVAEVQGAYEILVKVSLLGRADAGDARLRDIEFETTTVLNSKTQPRLSLGRNTVWVGAGDPTESIVLWPDLQGTNYRAWVVEEKNIAAQTRHPGYMGVLHAAKPHAPAWVVFRVDAPRELTRLVYGGRLYNRAPGSHIEFLHSFDSGASWTRSYTLTNTAEPWDVIHYETVKAVPPGTRSALVRFQLEGPAAGSDACSVYAIRIEADHRATETPFHPIDVTFHWSERQPDYSLVGRSHTEHIPRLPWRYNVNVGGADLPVVTSLRIAGAGARPDSGPGAKARYSDGRDVGGAKFVPRRAIYGTNLARGRPYTVSVPSATQWGAGDPEGTRLTDGVVGPPYPGGAAPASALLWEKGQHPEITVDLGEPKVCGAFRIQLGAGWPWWDALKGEFKDRVEVLTSDDGREFRSRGFFDLNLRWKDLPVNHFWPDEEVIAGHLFEHILPEPVRARYVRFKVTPERALTVSEVEVLDRIRYEPFDLRIALPADLGGGSR